MSKYLRFDAERHMKDLIQHLVTGMGYKTAAALDEEGEISEYDLSYIKEQRELASDICAVEYMYVRFKCEHDRDGEAITFMPYEGAGWNSIMDFTAGHAIHEVLTSFCDPLEG